MLNRIDDWYSNFLKDLLNIKKEAYLLRMNIVVLGSICAKNQFLLEDPILFERYAYLINMENDSVKDIKLLEEKMILLKENSTLFSITDITDEFEIIKENIFLEISYFYQTKEYLGLIDNNSTIEGNKILEFLECNENTSSFCYEQRKINGENLKLLRKERRD